MHSSRPRADSLELSCKHGLCASSTTERYCPFPSDEESIDSDTFYDNTNQRIP